MDLRQLDYFVEVAECRNITAAAASLNITQPSLTKSIRLLEEELGAQLLQRMPRGVELTVFGASLVRHARAIRAQLQDAVGELNTLRQGAAKRIVIGAGPSWLRRRLPQVLSKVAVASPPIETRVIAGFDEALLRSLRSGELDIVIAELPAADESADLSVTPLSEDQLVFCCREEHPLSKRRSALPSALLECRWVLPPRPARARVRLDALFIANALPPPEATIESDSLSFILAVLREIDAITFTTRGSIRKPDGAGIIELRIPAIAATRSAGFITRRGADELPAVRAIREGMQALCRSLPQN
jgi:LysR family transcriptional regulator of gallate degradation